MANNQLDAFLSGGTAPESMPDAAPAEPVPEAQPAPEATPETPPGPVQAPAETEPTPRQGDGRTVPLAVLEGERKQRQDWKEQAVRAQTERDELRKQLDEAKRAPPPQPQQPQQQGLPPQDIREAMAADPSIRAAVLTRLDTSEMLLRRDLGDDEVNALQGEFQQAMAQDPSLQARVLTQRDPYRWAHQHMKAIRLRQEIGDDPAGYEARMRARLEAEIMAGQPANGNGAARTSPAAGMAPSLASARSAAPRTAPAFSGPPSLDAILAERNTRR